MSASHPAGGTHRRRAAIAAAVALVGVGGFALGVASGDAATETPPDQLAMVDEACADLVGPVAALDAVEVIDEATVATVERLVTALPDALASEGATVLAAYRSLAAGNLEPLADDDLLAEAQVATQAIATYLSTACGVTAG